jgi:hypothetical protein
MAANEKGPLRLADCHNELGMKCPVEVNRKKRVITTGTTRSCLFGSKRLRAARSIDEENVIGAALVEQPTKNDLFIKRKITGVRRDDRCLESALRKGIKQ